MYAYTLIYRDNLQDETFSHKFWRKAGHAQDVDLHDALKSAVTQHARAHGGITVEDVLYTYSAIAVIKGHDHEINL
jgi:hypothetical protein